MQDNLFCRVHVYVNLSFVQGAWTFFKYETFVCNCIEPKGRVVYLISPLQLHQHWNPSPISIARWSPKGVG